MKLSQMWSETMNGKLQVCEGLPAGDYAIKQATHDDVEVRLHARLRFTGFL